MKCFKGKDLKTPGFKELTQSYTVFVFKGQKCRLLTIFTELEVHFRFIADLVKEELIPLNCNQRMVVIQSKGFEFLQEWSCYHVIILLTIFQGRKHPRTLTEHRLRKRLNARHKYKALKGKTCYFEALRTYVKVSIYRLRVQKWVFVSLYYILQARSDLIEFLCHVFLLICLVPDKTQKFPQSNDFVVQRYQLRCIRKKRNYSRRLFPVHYHQVD